MLRPLLTTFALLLAAPALAQSRPPEQVARSVDAVAGTPVRLGLYGNVGKDCAQGALPEVKITTPPKHGSLAVRQGKLRPGTLTRCPALEPAAQGVTYEPDARHKGPDEVAYEVRHADGRVQLFTVRVTVAPKGTPPRTAPRPLPGAKPDEGTSL